MRASRITPWAHRVILLTCKEVLANISSYLDGELNASADSSISTRERTEMETALTLMAVLVLWWVLQVWLLPRFGVPT